MDAEGLRGGAGGGRDGQPAATRSMHDRADARTARRRAREFALQGLYQWQLAGNDAATQCCKPPRRKRRASTRRRPRVSSTRAWRGVTRDYDALAAAIEPHLDRKTAELSPVERAILVIGAWELSTAARHPVPRRDQRGGRARQSVRRHRRPQVRQRRARQARRGPARGRDRRALTPCFAPSSRSLPSFWQRPRTRSARSSCTAATTPMHASSLRKRSSARRGSPRRSCASLPASTTRRSARSATTPKATSGTAARSILVAGRGGGTAVAVSFARGLPSSRRGRAPPPRSPTTRSPRSTASSSGSAATPHCSRGEACLRRAAGRISRTRSTQETSSSRMPSRAARATRSSPRSSRFTARTVHSRI